MTGNSERVQGYCSREPGGGHKRNIYIDRSNAMYCPNCGNKNSADQKFCRSCGLGLQKIGESLAEQLPTTIDKSLQQRKEKLERLGMAALSVFGAGIAIPILYSIIYKTIWLQGKVLTGVGMLALVVALACGLLSVILFAKANEVKETAAKRPLTDSPELKEHANTRELSPEALPQPPAFSVADRTTELLLEGKEGGAKKN